MASCRAVSRVHRHFLFQVVRGLFQREFAERELYIHFYAERTKTHEAVNRLAGARIVVEQSSLQHHLLRVKSNTLVSVRIVVVTTNRVLVFPGKTELKIMSGNPFVNRKRPRILLPWRA